MKALFHGIVPGRDFPLCRESPFAPASSTEALRHRKKHGARMDARPGPPGNGTCSSCAPALLPCPLSPYFSFLGICFRHFFQTSTRKNYKFLSKRIFFRVTAMDVVGLEKERKKNEVDITALPGTCAARYRSAAGTISRWRCR
ncbi:hypothetical protein [Pantoea sp. 18069]|uniref:hypothetical protein n=1 Tax=Pantoea sp. 18069 TaxID=2681415 RepID=UPI001356E097|nr:hypothetical protein [Pantoea sp. 18069]